MHKLNLPYQPPPEHKGKLTRHQAQMKQSGYEVLIAKPIRQLDPDGGMYDLSERLTLQLSFFPFGGRCDVIDALSRVHDMDPLPPRGPVDESELEPEIV
jgi:hypothetical protein